MNGISIVIPVYNEADCIVENSRTLLVYLEKQCSPFEIIIVSNGSTDKTVMLGNALASAGTRIRFFHLSQKGVGQAFKKGVLSACYPSIVSLDMDLSTDLGFIGRAHTLLERGARIVVGSKKKGAQERSLVRVMGSGLFIICARVLLDLPFEDYSIGAKAYNRAGILKYLGRIDRGTSYVIDIIFQAYRAGAQIVEIPVKCTDFRPSRFNIWREAVYRFANLFKLWRNFRGLLF